VGINPVEEQLGLLLDAARHICSGDETQRGTHLGLVLLREPVQSAWPLSFVAGVGPDHRAPSALGLFNRLAFRVSRP
jgi:hypothetical protein